MHGFKEDLLNVVARCVVEDWELSEGNVEYCADRVRKSGLSTADLADYLFERKHVAPVCVITVFDHIVNPIEEGGEE
ncbi:MAG: hypothetical protein K2L73_02150 [Muribaculaceae bacterium]|nr:hypothetical protein [Muribaculaceae bacterium]